MDEINRVARMMVDAEPASDLAARVRARLDATPTRPERSVWGTWQPAAIAACLLLAAVWSRGPEVQESRSPEVLGSAGPESTVVQGSRELTSPKAGPEVSGPASNISPSRTLPSLRHSTGAIRAQEQATPALSAEELAWMERRMPALDPVVALQMDHLATDSIQPEALSITPLTMSALPTTSADAERRIDR
jgi:hypothetical protein